MHYHFGVPKATIAEIALVVCVDVNLRCYPTLEELNRFAVTKTLIGKNLIFECGVTGCARRGDEEQMYNLGGWVVCARHGLDIMAILHEGGFRRQRHFAGYVLAETIEEKSRFLSAHSETAAQQAERYRKRINREEFRRRGLRMMPPIPQVRKGILRLVKEGSGD